MRFAIVSSSSVENILKALRIHIVAFLYIFSNIFKKYEKRALL